MGKKKNKNNGETIININYTDNSNQINNHPIIKNNQIIAENAGQTVEKTSGVNHTSNEPAPKNYPRLSIIIATITLIVTVISTYVAYMQYKDSHISTSEYKIYLSSEYTALKVNSVTDLTATLNFDTDSISICAYLNSVIDGDTLLMIRNNETEWHKKVYFEHTGTYEVIARAMAPNGETIEATLEIEVIP